MIFPGIKRVVSFTAMLSLLAIASVCEESMAEEVIASRATSDQVLVLYNDDWNEDIAGSGKGQDSRELAEYYQAMHTDPVTGRKPFLLPLTCIHGDKHLNDWFIKEKSTDNKNAIAFAGPGDPPEDFNWVLDSRHVEVIVPEKNTDWDSVSISIRSEANDATKSIYRHQQAQEGVAVTVSGLPKSHGFAITYPPVKAGEGRCFRFDSTQAYPGTVEVSLTAADMEGHLLSDLSVRYTRWINWRKKRAGHLFQGRYKAVLVDGDSYLLELIRYIHLDPVRAGMVTDPEKYLLSGHRAYLGKEILPWLTMDRVFKQFGESVARAQARYKSFIMDGLGEEHRPEFHGGQKDSRLLGDDHFLDKCLSGVEMLPCHLTVQDIVDKVCLNYGIRADMLPDPSQQRTASEARAVAGWLARELGCCTLSDVGRLFNRDVGSISSAVRRLSERMQKDPELAERVAVLKAELEPKLNNLEA